MSKDQDKAASLRAILSERKTVRKFTKKRLPRADLETLVWAAYGHTHSASGYKMRTAPSAGATYPVELWFAVEDVEETEDGLYFYDTEKEQIAMSKIGRLLTDIRRASLDQEFISMSNLVVLMIYDPSKIAPDYGRKSRDYALLECGHIAQNTLLMASSLKLGAVPVGAYDEKDLRRLIGISGDKEVFYMVAVGTIG